MAIQTNKKPIDLDQARKAADEASGAAKAAVAELRELGYETRVAAEAEIARLDGEIARLEQEAGMAYRLFEEKWGTTLNAT